MYFERHKVGSKKKVKVKNNQAKNIILSFLYSSLN